MRTLLSALPLLGCAAMTIGCARMMGRRSKEASKELSASPDEVRQLAEEVEGLRARLDGESHSTPRRDGSA